MTTLTDLTSAVEQRALLGVSDKELLDATVSLPVYWKAVKAELNTVSATLLATYEALPANGLTDAQLRFQEAVELFAALSAALMIAVSLPQFSARTVSDGKAMMQRQLDAPAQTLENLRQRHGVAREELSLALKALSATSRTAFTLPIGIATLGATDPITGS